MICLWIYICSWSENRLHIKEKEIRVVYDMPTSPPSSSTMEGKDHVHRMTILVFECAEIIDCYNSTFSSRKILYY